MATATHWDSSRRADEDGGGFTVLVRNELFSGLLSGVGISLLVLANLAFYEFK